MVQQVRRLSLTQRIENDPNHHLTGAFLPQTPVPSKPPSRATSPIPPRLRRSPPQAISFEAPRWLQWATNDQVALRILITPIVLKVVWDFLSPHLGLDSISSTNPFAPIFLLSGHVTESSANDPRYTKSHLDLPFLAYYVIFFSFVRQILVIRVARPLASYFGIRKESKIDRFGEQFYALIYFTIVGAWGYRIMGQLPTYWYKTDEFWRGYPHWDLKPELKRYYLMQFSYWLQQFLVLVLGLEKPRKDYYELVAHHFVTLWLVGWSYWLNYTVIGSAVYMSMDIPDAAFALAKLLNYMRYERAKVVAFVVFIFIWTYFRHFLNIKILWSTLYESHLAPASSKVWDSATGRHMPSWMPAFIFASIAALQALNLFWYFLIWRVLIRAILTKVTDDERSDHEDDDEEEPSEAMKED